jgi:ferredoxin-thioredoxin reductase catalytic subunit
MADREEIRSRMQKDAESRGYALCPDPELLDDLLDGLALNEERYGYGACPCRIASGLETYDSDIVCPCEYRDADCDEHGMCYCCLFVTEEVAADPSKMGSIPERRPVEAQDAAMEAVERREKGEEIPVPRGTAAIARSAREKSGLPVWRCVVCGYLAARNTPPPICPICKARADRFESFVFG